MKNQKCESAEIAANWWANALKGRAKQDAKLDGDIANLLLLLVATSNRPDESKIENFKQLLENELTKRLTNNEESRIILSVDYGAEGTLADIARAANIYCGTGSAFPVKTIMVVTKDLVTVSNGYGAENVTLYSANTANPNGDTVN